MSLIATNMIDIGELLADVMLNLSIRERPSGFIGMPVGRANDKTPSEWKVVNI